MAYEDDLTRLAIKHATDKWGSHWYARHYHRHLKHLRTRTFSMLEIGIGGYSHLDHGGASLRMWKEYFPNATIVGLDIHDKSHLREERIVTIQGDQNDESLLADISRTHGPFDVIIDDGSHISSHVIRSFEVLFPLLKEGGTYAVEDTQTSYWKNWGGDAYDFNRLSTSLGYLKSLTDGLNFSEIPNLSLPIGYIAKNTVGMHFYHSLVIIDKGVNDEGSTVVIDNKPNSSTGGE